jgi:hypothetical protein
MPNVHVRIGTKTQTTRGRLACVDRRRERQEHGRDGQLARRQRQRRRRPSWPTPTLTPSPSASKPNPTATPDPTSRPPGPSHPAAAACPAGVGPGRAPRPRPAGHQARPGGAVVPAGRAARRSRANVRHPAAAQARTASPFALDGLPGITLRRHRRWRVRDAPSARAASLASSAAPTVPAGAAVAEAVDPYVNPYVIPYVNPYVIPYALRVRTPTPPGGRITAGHAPRGASRPQKPRPTRANAG